MILAASQRLRWFSPIAGYVLTHVDGKGWLTVPDFGSPRLQQWFDTDNGNGEWRDIPTVQETINDTKTP